MAKGRNRCVYIASNSRLSVGILCIHSLQTPVFL